jgi:hypothetical protein
MILFRTSQTEALIQTKDFYKANTRSKPLILGVKNFKNFLVYHT